MSKGVKSAFHFVVNVKRCKNKQSNNIIMSKTRINQMTNVQKEVLELFRRKNTDYGDAFANYGNVGVIVLMGDKIQRLISVSNNGVALIDS